MGLRKQGMWVQTTPCHVTGDYSILEQNIYILQLSKSKFLIRVKIFWPQFINNKFYGS